MSGEIGEPLLERQRQQEPGEQSHSRLHYPQFLQQAVPITVEPLEFGFTTLAGVPALIVLRMIDIHGRDHRTGPPLTGLSRSWPGQPAMNSW